ncbi:MAG: 3-hydroxyacyl-ACP dehydratase FabZ [Candidatus Brocadiales bacterium]
MTGLNPPPINLLPHSYPFVLIDRIVQLEQGKRSVCLKNVSINEGFFQGHFKGNPVMPGVLIIEAMAQTSGLIIGSEETSLPSNEVKGLFSLGSIKYAKFKKPVVPGDQLIITSSLVHKLPPLYVFEVVASVEGEIVSEAEITLALK